MVRTIAQRLDDAKRARIAAAEAVARDLAAYATAHGGRFLVYGSAARGDMKADSDIDILLDFPEAARAEAWRAAEDICAAHGIQGNIAPMGWLKAEFLAHVLPTSVELK